MSTENPTRDEIFGTTVKPLDSLIRLNNTEGEKSYRDIRIFEQYGSGIPFEDGAIINLYMNEYAVSTLSTYVLSKTSGAINGYTPIFAVYLSPDSVSSDINRFPYFTEMFTYTASGTVKTYPYGVTHPYSWNQSARYLVLDTGETSRTLVYNVSMWCTGAYNSDMEEMDESDVASALPGYYHKELKYTLRITILKHGSGYVKYNEATCKISPENTRVLLTTYARNNRSDTSKQYSLVHITGNDNSDSFNIVSSYTISGGPEVPFETLSLKLSYKNLTAVYPDFEDVSVIDLGNTTIQISGIGFGLFTVTKSKLSGGTLTLTAYCIAERLRGAKLTNKIDTTPLDMMLKILENNEYGCKFDASHIICNATDTSKKFSFKSGADVWAVYQACATALGCKVFFAGGLAYIVDYCHIEEYPAFYYTTPIDIYGTNTRVLLEGKVIGNIELGDEGSDVVRNDIRVYYSEDSETYEEPDISLTSLQSGTMRTKFLHALSQERYGVHSASFRIQDIVTTIPGDGNSPVSDFAKMFANYFLRYRAEPQTSIGFTVGESTRSGAWVAEFPNVFALTALYSEEDGVSITNKSVYPMYNAEKGENEYNPRPLALALSKFTRKYPESQTEYWFGIASTIDLASSTSQIRAKLGQ